MKSILRGWAGLGLALMFTTALAAFEGRVSLAIKSGKEKEQVIDYAFKDGVVRLEPKSDEAEGTAMIMNWAKREMLVLIPEQQMYMVMPLKSGPAGQTAAATEPEAKIEKTGETALILGYVCEQYLTSDQDGVTEMWITDQLGHFSGLGAGASPLGGMMGGGRQAAAPSGWEKALESRKGAFPLRVVGRDKRGRETFRLEAKKIEPGPLPAALFAAPAGFQKLSMPTMGGFGG